MKVKIKDVPPHQIEIKYLVSAIFYNFKDATILEIALMGEQNLIGQETEVLIQVNSDTLENVPDSIKLRDCTTTHVAVESKRLSCYLCGSKQHLRKVAYLHINNNMKDNINRNSKNEEKEKETSTCTHTTLCTTDNTTL